MALFLGGDIMLGWIIVGSIYGASILVNIGTLTGYSFRINQKIKKEGYKVEKKHRFHAIDSENAFFALIITLCPILNTMISFALPKLIERFEEGYKNYKNYLIRNNLLKKSEKRLAFEENAIIEKHKEEIKKQKFREARERFYEGKMGNFDSLSDVEKIEILKEEREKLNEKVNVMDLNNA